ncbi:MAG: adenylosuccinate lyase, partial [Candidatus Fonsibacter sp.]
MPSTVVDAYEKVKNKIDLDSIDKREFTLKHDVKARIEEFNSLAGFEYIHIGLTSRDLTENIELFQIRTALLHVHAKSLMVLKLLGEKINQYKTIEFVA